MMRTGLTARPDVARAATVVSVAGASAADRADQLAVEEPLAIRISYGPPGRRERTTISITMRTPGHDDDLAAGLLFAEGVIGEPSQVLAIACGDNSVRVDLHPEVTVDLNHLDRRGYTTSSCGICGKTSIEAVEAACEGPRAGGTPVDAAVIHGLPESLRAAQPAFSRTGGLHAAALFDLRGHLLAVREDIGRHNAVDKLIGAEFHAGRVPLEERILLVSGRASFELIQKAAAAGTPIFAAVGAPSSLAVDLAQRMGMTLLGFVRDGRFNIYSGPERIVL
ncbi:MAG TPA: formate dehydrogenase accessory sulfurtransferase FdhD [Urbifossiella sp.]|nr:formate dehydrogenase accessory sulfurtransferase FdhD [Urbifossiella sp.]